MEQRQRCCNKCNNIHYDKADFFILDASEDEIFFNIDPLANSHTPQAQQVCHLPHIVSKPSTRQQAKLQDLCKYVALQKLRSSFGVMYSEGVHKRLIDMINQCRYIASKKGMDKNQVIDSIREDENSTKNYITSFPFPQWNTPQCVKEIPKISFISTSNCAGASQCVSNCEGGDHQKCWESICNNVKANRVDDPVSLRYNDSSKILNPHPPHFKIERVHDARDEIDDDENGYEHHFQHPPHSCFFVSRPPTRHGVSEQRQPIPNFDERLMGQMEPGLLEDSDDESDFDPSQSFDLFDEINSANASVNKRRCYDYDQVGMEGSNANMTPNRRPGTHNLLTALDDTATDEVEKKTDLEKSDNQGSSILNAGEQELLKSQNDVLHLSEEDKAYEEAKQLMITTARAKACSSYIQLRKKVSEGCTQTDQHLMTFNFSRLLMAKEAAEQKTLQNNKHINNNLK